MYSRAARDCFCSVFVCVCAALEGGNCERLGVCPLVSLTTVAILLLHVCGAG